MLSSPETALRGFRYLKVQRLALDRWNINVDERALRSRSKALLGREYRLEIAAAIDGCHGETFTTQSIASATVIFYPRVQEDLQRLLRAGLIHVAEKGRDVRYQAVETAYWDAASRLLRESRGDPQAHAWPDAGQASS